MKHFWRRLSAPDGRLRKPSANSLTGKLVDLFPRHQVTATDLETAAWLVYPSRAYVPLKVRAFIEFLKAEVAPHDC